MCFPADPSCPSLLVLHFPPGHSSPPDTRWDLTHLPHRPPEAQGPGVCLSVPARGHLETLSACSRRRGVGGTCVCLCGLLAAPLEAGTGGLWGPQHLGPRLSQRHAGGAEALRVPLCSTSSPLCRAPPQRLVLLPEGCEAGAAVTCGPIVLRCFAGSLAFNNCNNSRQL